MVLSSIFSFFAAHPNVLWVSVGILFLSIAATNVGSFIVLRKQSLIADSTAHSVLPGVCIAFLLFQSKSILVLFVGALISGWISIVLLHYIYHNTKLKKDAATAIVLSSFFGLGIFILSKIQQMGIASQSGLDKFLFGKAASLVAGDMKITVLLSLVVLFVLVLFYKEFKIISFDREYASSIGISVNVFDQLFSLLTVVVITIGIQFIGVILMAATMITPIIAARFWSNKLWHVMLISSFVAIAASFLGIWISFIYPKMPTGPWIVVFLTIFAFFSITFAPQKGILSNVIQTKKYERKILAENILKMFFHYSERNKAFGTWITAEHLRSTRDIRLPNLLMGLERLKKRDLVLEKENQYRLTEEGLIQAKRVVRLHRLWELYLTKKLHLKDDHVHVSADSLEHALTPELEQFLLQRLDIPEKDPHNKTIPI